MVWFSYLSLELIVDTDNAKGLLKVLSVQIL